MKSLVILVALSLSYSMILGQERVKKGYYQTNPINISTPHYNDPLDSIINHDIRPLKVYQFLILKSRHRSEFGNTLGFKQNIKGKWSLENDTLIISHPPLQRVNDLTHDIKFTINGDCLIPINSPRNEGFHRKTRRQRRK